MAMGFVGGLMAQYILGNGKMIKYMVMDFYLIMDHPIRHSLKIIKHTDIV